MYNKYLDSINCTNEVIKRLNGKEEIGRISLSEQRWALVKNGKIQHHTPKKGEIYQFDFGKNYIPEMSYEHRGLVVGVKKKLLYVLPIFTYKEREHKDAVDTVNNPDSKSDFFLLKSSDFSFITHDSVIKLNDIRSVSVNRIQYSHNSRIDIASEVYRIIENLTIQKHFAQFYNNHLQTIKKNNDLENKETELLKRISVLENENNELRKKVK